MSKLIYISDDTINFPNREASKITFEVADDLTITEFKLICMRLAAAMGYSADNISDEFELDNSDIDVIVIPLNKPTI